VVSKLLQKLCSADVVTLLHLLSTMACVQVKESAQTSYGILTAMYVFIHVSAHVHGPLCISDVYSEN